MDAVYIRLEGIPPPSIRWARFPFRCALRHQVLVWEFNTVPEFGRVIGESEDRVQRAVGAYRRYASGCDLAICVSRSLSDYVRTKLGVRRVKTVANGSDPDLFRPDVRPIDLAGRSDEQLHVVWIGSGGLAWHDFDVLRRASVIICERGLSSAIVFHLIGQEFLRAERLPVNVHYHGPQDYHTLPRWLAAMDVGLCIYREGPADYGSPLKLFDYMASGLTVVGTYQPQLHEVFEKLGQTDLLVPPGDAESLAQVLISLARDRERVRRHGEAGRQLVINYYNWRRAVQEAIQEIEVVRDGRR
jgi:glycosyltransferase involved in cell wall biosynthesis